MSLIQFLQSKEINLSETFVYLSSEKELKSGNAFFTKEECDFINQQLKNDLRIAELSSPEKMGFVISPIDKGTPEDILEKFRRAGAAVCFKIKPWQKESVTLYSKENAANLLAFTEGLALANYKFSKYKSKSTNPLTKISISSEINLTNEITELSILTEAVYKTRDLVNEPVLFLTAEQFQQGND